MTSKIEKHSANLAGVLLVVTTLAILSQVLPKTLSLDLKQLEASQILSIDDHYEGGESVATAEYSEKHKALVLRCVIVKSEVAWPYCSVSMNFVKGRAGLDLSGYDAFNIAVRYEKPRSQAIRFQVRNFNPNYSVWGDDLSLKYSVKEFVGQNRSYPVNIPLDEFHVPTWWLTSKKAEYINGIPEFDNVHSIDIVTGYVTPPGEYTILIEDISLTGKWVQDNDLYIGLLVIWGLVGLVFWLKQSNQFGRMVRHSKPKKEIEMLTQLLKEHCESTPGALVSAGKVSTDNETGFPDYPGLAKMLVDVGNRVPRHDLCLLLLDIHCPNSLEVEEIDNVLKQCAQAIMEITRDSDFIARWGVSGFVLVCEGTELTFATQISKKILEKLSVHKFDASDNFDPSENAIAASIGVASLGEGSIAALIEGASKALQNAKIRGGGHAVTATNSMADIVVE